MPQKPARLAEILKAHGVASQLELLLLRKLRRVGLPEGEAQVRGIPGRKFAFDRAWRAQMVAVNVQGAIYVRGAHSTGTGIERDCEVACLASLAGWKYLPVTEKQIKSGQAVEWIAQALGVEAIPCLASPSRPPAASPPPAREAGVARSHVATSAGSRRAGSATTR